MQIDLPRVDYNVKKKEEKRANKEIKEFNMTHDPAAYEKIVKAITKARRAGDDNEVERLLGTMSDRQRESYLEERKRVMAQFSKNTES